MDLLQRIKADRLTARKAKDTIRATLLTTLVGEAETALKGKQAAKFDMLKLVKKFQDNCKETLDVKYTEAVRAEIWYLEGYLPEQLTEGEIKDIILYEVNAKTMGTFMGHMNKNYKGCFDGALANKLFKEFG
jgi:hypothetical protein